MAFSLETQMVIKFGDDKWHPKQETIDGVTYFEFSKWDRGFVRFITGKSLDLRKGSANQATVDCEYLRQVLAARQKACDEALSQALDEGEGGESLKKRRRKANMADSHLTARVLKMTLPGIPEEGLNERECRVLYDGAGSAAVHVEMSWEVLNHLKKGISNSEKKDRKDKA